MPTWFLLHYKERPVLDDIVTRLRHIHMELTADDYDDVITAAADEIERLRADLERKCVQCVDETTHQAKEIIALRAEVARKADYAERMDALAEERLINSNRLRAAGDGLAVAYRTLGGLDAAYDTAIQKWEEARRG